MITFRDFVPDLIKEQSFFSEAQHELFGACIQEANQWIEKNDIEVINLETVVLPNLFDKGQEGTEDASLRTSGEYGSYWYQFVRVWHKI